MTPMIGDWFSDSPRNDVGGFEAHKAYPYGESFNFSYDAKQRIVGDVMRRVSEQGGIMPNDGLNRDFGMGGSIGHKPL